MGSSTFSEETIPGIAYSAYDMGIYWHCSVGLFGKEEVWW